MVAVPAVLAVTVPSDATVATEVLLDDQVTPLFVALEGETVAVRVVVSPSVKETDDLERLTPVTLITLALTVTWQEAVFPPSFVRTVIVVLPGATAVTEPPETFATLALPELHETL